MQFENLTLLWEMNGHGPFVWSAYAIALIILIGLVVVPLRRRQKFFIEQHQIVRRRAQAQSQRAKAQMSH